MKNLWVALGIGTAVTLGLFGLAFLAAREGNVDLSYALYWQAWCLQQLIPCQSAGSNIGQACEITHWHMMAFYAGLPIGVIVYSLLAYIGQKVFMRR